MPAAFPWLLLQRQLLVPPSFRQRRQQLLMLCPPTPDTGLEAKPWLILHAVNPAHGSEAGNIAGMLSARGARRRDCQVGYPLTSASIPAAVYCHMRTECHACILIPFPVSSTDWICCEGAAPVTVMLQ